MFVLMLPEAAGVVAAVVAAVTTGPVVGQENGVDVQVLVVGLNKRPTPQLN